MPPRFIEFALLQVIGGGLLAALVLWAARLKHGVWMVGALIFLPVAVVYGFDVVRVVNSHGFMHTGIVLRIIGGEIPPTDPLIAGEPLSYPWLQHVAVAWVCELFAVHPSLVLAGWNLAALILALFLLVKIGESVEFEPAARVYGVYLALFGISPLCYGPAMTVLGRLTDFVPDRRAYPLHKFHDTGANSTGIVLYLVAVWAILEIIRSANNGRLNRWHALLFVSAVLGGLLYPFAWLSIFCLVAALFAVQVVIRREEHWKKWLSMVIVVAAATAAVYPWMSQLMSSRAPDTGLKLAKSPAVFVQHLLSVLWFLVPIGIVTALVWPRFRADWQATPQRRQGAILLGLSAATSLLLYLAIKAPVENEYKFLIGSVMACGVLAAPALVALERRWTLLAFGFVWILSWPSLVHFRHYVMCVPADDFTLAAHHTLHTDPDQNKLYRWIREQTGFNAVFLDTHRTVTVFGERLLFVGLDRRMPDLYRPGKVVQRDGLSIRSVEFHREVSGRPKALVDARLSAANAIFTSEPIKDDSIWQTIEAADQGDGVFVIARETKVIEKLAGEQHVEEVFAGRAAHIFRVRQQPSKALATE